MRKVRGIPVISYMLLGGLLLSACAGQVRAQRGEDNGADVQVEVNGTPFALTLPARATDDSPEFEHTPEMEQTGTPEAVGTGQPDDDNSAENKTEATGAVTSIDAGQVTIDGQIYL